MLFSSFLLILPLVHALVVQRAHDSHDDHDHDHVTNQALPDSWFHPQGHRVHSLFKRAPGDGTDYAQVGTPTWSAGFPVGTPDPKALPTQWVTVMNNAVAAGLIPNIPQSSGLPGQNPAYPPGVNPNGPQVCSATYKCRIPGDIWDAPDGVFASSFDDGPVPSTTNLVQFLDSQNLSTTHFMIGVNIMNNAQQFSAAFNSGNDIAVHTWTHPYMTTLSNLDVLGQLGWTMQLIHNSTGGRVPRYWRPPYGDSDMRVRAIAKEVFGLETVIWNQDTVDWNSTPDVIHSRLQGWLAGPKSPGLMILEHELTDVTVGGFIAAFPLIASNGWKFASLAQIIGGGRSYQNALSSESGDVQSADIISSSLLSSSTSSSSSSSAPTPTSPALTSPSPSSKTSAGSVLSPFPTGLCSVFILLTSSLTLYL